MRGIATVEQTVFGSGQFDRLWRGGQVQVNAQGVAIAQAPACGQCLVAQHVGAQRTAARQVRYDMAPAQFEQLLIKAVPAGDHFLTLWP
ncbi:hypothetical protein D3C73_1517900 [compost metagenome]